MEIVLLCVTYCLLLNQIDLSTEDFISEGLEIQQRSVGSYFLSGALNNLFSFFQGIGLKWLKNFTSKFKSLDGIMKLLTSILNLPKVQKMLGKVPGLLLQAVLAAEQWLAEKSLKLKNQFKEYSYLQGVADGDFVSTFVNFYKVQEVVKFISKHIQSQYFQNFLQSLRSYMGTTKVILGNVLPKRNKTQVMETVATTSVPVRVTIPPVQVTTLSVRFSTQGDFKWSPIEKHTARTIKPQNRNKGFFGNLFG